MTTKSNNAKLHYVPGTSRTPRSVSTLLAQMADLARGERIKALREHRHLSQPAVVDLLEKKAGARVVTLRGYQAWEAGGGIRWDNAKVLADMHDVAPEWIMSGDEERPATPDLSLVKSDDDRLARIEEKLDGGIVEQQDLRAQIAHQNENLADQTKLLAELKTLVGEIRSLVAVLQDAEVIERSAAAAVRSLPEWPAPPGAKPAPAQEPQRATGTTSRGGRQGRGQRRNTA